VCPVLGAFMLPVNVNDPVCWANNAPVLHTSRVVVETKSLNMGIVFIVLAQIPF
jgi:hypothetical protein